MAYLVAIVTLLLAVSGCRGQNTDVASSGSASGSDAAAEVQLESFDFGGDFELTDHTGAPFKLSDLKGKAVVVFFGYTTCPDVCPLTMSKIAAARQSLGADGAKVATVFISVDVGHDTPAVLANYIKSFDEPLVGLTGTKAQVDAVVQQYRAAYEITPTQTSALGYQVSHSSYTYLVDPHGQLRHVFRDADTPDAIASGIRQVLREGGA